jgi:hypothetical protein
VRCRWPDAPEHAPAITLLQDKVLETFEPVIRSMESDSVLK